MASARDEPITEAIADDWQDTLAELRELRAAVTVVGDGFVELARREGALARAELSENVSLAVRGAIAGGIAIPFALLALAFAALAAMFGLALVLPLWAAAAVVAAVLAVVAAVFALIARSRFAATQLIPQQTIRSLQEDVQWAREQLKRNVR